MSDTPAKSGPSATVVIVVGSVLLLVLAGIIIALAATLNSSQRAAPAQAADDEPGVSEIVLNATWADGDPLDEDLALTEGLITGRLEDAGITGTGFAVDGDQIRITFEDDADQGTLDHAAEVLDVAFTADFRPVLELGILCGRGSDYTDKGPDTESTVCNEDDFAAYELGVSQVAGDAIVGATAQPQEGSDEYWSVSIYLNPDGTKDFAALTQQLADGGEGKNHLAIVLNGKVIAAPAVNDPIFGGQVLVTGSFDQARAESIAAQLRFASQGLVLSVDSTSLAE